MPKMEVLRAPHSIREILQIYNFLANPRWKMGCPALELNRMCEYVYILNAPIFAVSKISPNNPMLNILDSF